MPCTRNGTRMMASATDIMAQRMASCRIVWPPEKRTSERYVFVLTAIVTQIGIAIAMKIRTGRSNRYHSPSRNQKAKSAVAMHRTMSISPTRAARTPRGSSAVRRMN
jgi:hypothetical protein